MIEEFPEGPIRDYAIHTYKVRKARLRLIKRYTKALDSRVFIHKWYPWSYWGYKPRMVLQGWYNLDLAKQKYADTYGKDNLRHVKWVKGKEALERGFNVGKRLYIGGKWRAIRNKSYFNMPHSIVRLSLKKSKSHRRSYLEKRVITTSKLMLDPDKIILNTSKRMGKKLSHLQKEKTEKAKNLYTE